MHAVCKVSPIPCKIAQLSIDLKLQTCSHQQRKLFTSQNRKKIYSNFNVNVIKQDLRMNC